MTQIVRLVEYEYSVIPPIIVLLGGLQEAARMRLFFQDYDFRIEREMGFLETQGCA